MPSGLSGLIDQLSRERRISRKAVIEALEQAFLAAERRRHPEDVRLEVKYNPETDEMELFRVLTVVARVQNPEREISLEKAREEFHPDAQLGDELLERVPKKLTRVGAQAARQQLLQRIRDAERQLIYKEFKEREGQLIPSGLVTRILGRKLIVNLGSAEAILPEDEQIPREHYRVGDHIRAYILRVDMAAQGPEIILSRTHPGFLIKLFEQEVPEVSQKIVEIKAAAREPGSRAKIAVASKDPDVDPVGACVGMRGSRVQAITQELRGERIDVIAWDPRPVEFVRRALAPAKVTRIVLDEEEKKMEIVVPDEELAQAIGKRGQNVRLASKLTGYDLTVKSESEAAKEAQDAREALMAVPGIDANLADRLFDEGIASPEELAQLDEESLAEIEGIGRAKARQLLAAVRSFLAEKEAESATEGETAVTSAPSEQAAGEEAFPSKPASEEAAAPVASTEEAGSPPQSVPEAPRS